MTSISPNGFRIGKITDEINSALKGIDKSYFCISDSFDHVALKIAKNKLEKALEDINSLLEKKIWIDPSFIDTLELWKTTL